MSTFITQLTMLNMLIAIMGDTFGRIMEAREVSGTKTKLKLMADNDHTIPKTTKRQDNKVFFYVITPEDEDGDDGDSTEAAVHQLAKQVQSEMDQLRAQITRDTTRLEQQQEEVLKRVIAIDRDLRSSVGNLIRQQKIENQDLMQA